MSKILIAYFSQTGNTKKVAEAIAAKTGGELADIAGPATPPASDLSAYDVVFVGTPNWAATFPPQVKDFLLSLNLAGKKLAVFVTHGRGGLGNIPDDLAKLLPDADKTEVYDGNLPDGLDAWLAAAGF
ncbi:MAG: flavodoxin domain-containing protein [Oscillospiraceae bacterium]|jgi:flavodoxin|nr:flavodoxin domain-containing protein [Oscillospiraceae bacterium]